MPLRFVGPGEVSAKQPGLIFAPLLENVPNRRKNYQSRLFADLLNKSSQSRRDHLLRLRADYLINQLAVFEYEQGGDAADVELRGGARVFIYVEFGDLIAALRFSGELIEKWRQHPAWPAPFGPGVDENGFRAGSADDLGRE